MAVMWSCDGHDTSDREIPSEIPDPPQFNNVTFENCNDDQVKKLAWAVAYLNAAAISPAYRRCLKSAIEGSYGPGTAIWNSSADAHALHTHQESFFVGPYLACDEASGNYREPEFVYQKSPFLYQNRLLAFEAALTLSQSYDKLKIRCIGSSNNTAQAPNDHGYFRVQHDDPYRFDNLVEVGLRMFSQFPDHQTEDYNEPARFGTINPAYPIDEISGILLHEILHNYGFEHGTSANNECGYDQGYENGRFHSLNEIVEACMSEVVEASIALCADSCSNSGAVQIASNPAAVTNISHPNTCQCYPYN